jgi:mycofactocin precursor
LGKEYAMPEESTVDIEDVEVVEEPVAESLIEEISIDGMCGVY